MAKAEVTVHMIDLPAILLFMADVGRVAEEAPGMTGYEIQSELFRAFEDLAERIDSAPDPP